MTIRTLITGANGFVGSELMMMLRKKQNQKVFLTDKSDSKYGDIVECDLNNYDELSALLADAKPTRIFHAAGSYSNDFITDLTSNVISTRNLLQALLELGLKSRVLLIGSASEYGSSNMPIDESTNLNPITIYGLTKKFQYELMCYYYKTYNMDILMARAFNLFGNGMSQNLLIGKLYSQIFEYKNNTIKNIVLGDLSAKRDYMYVKDACADFDFLMENGSAGEVYNVASGKLIEIRELIEKILIDSGVPLSVLKEKKKCRFSNIEISQASIKKINHLKEFKSI